MINEDFILPSATLQSVFPINKGPPRRMETDFWFQSGAIVLSPPSVERPPTDTSQSQATRRWTRSSSVAVLVKGMVKSGQLRKIPPNQFFYLMCVTVKCIKLKISCRQPNSYPSSRPSRARLTIVGVLSECGWVFFRPKQEQRTSPNDFFFFWQTTTFHLDPDWLWQKFC